MQVTDAIAPSEMGNRVMRTEGVRALRGARAARAPRGANENERRGHDRDGGDRAPRARG